MFSRFDRGACGFSHGLAVLIGGRHIQHIPVKSDICPLDEKGEHGRRLRVDVIRGRRDARWKTRRPSPVRLAEEYDMPTGFLPRTDAGLLASAEAFSSQISAAAASFGVPAGTATSLASTVSDYADAYAAATNESTRTKGKIAAKNTARAALRSACSDVAKLVYGTATVTDEQLTDLGLTVRDVSPSPVPPPALAPLLTLLLVVGRVAKYKIADAAEPNTRRRPANAIGATILSYVGATPPPANDPGWKIEGQTGRTTFSVQFGNDVEPGTPCWVACMWYNRRGQYSPACQPVQAYLQIGPVAEAA
jgi:hypothetical protein